MQCTRRTLAGLVVLLITVAGCGGGPQEATARADATVEAREPVSAPAQAPAPSAPSTPSAEPSPAPSTSPQLRDFPDGIEPARVRIPSIGVDADVIELGQLDDGSLETPEDFSETGWWRGGPRPGQLGAAVIAGHVDSTSGPAVFYELRNLREGDRIVLTDGGGRKVRFTVDRLEQHPKADFPTRSVYGYTRQPSLRLVTCGGQFDSGRRSYVDNIVVFARLVS